MRHIGWHCFVTDVFFALTFLLSVCISCWRHCCPNLFAKSVFLQLIYCRCRCSEDKRLQSYAALIFVVACLYFSLQYCLFHLIVPVIVTKIFPFLALDKIAQHIFWICSSFNTDTYWTNYIFCCRIYINLCTEIYASVGILAFRVFYHVPNRWAWCKWKTPRFPPTP